MVIAYILDVTFLVDHFYFHFLPFFRCEVVPFYDLVEELSHHFSRLVVASFDVFGTYSIAVWRFACFEFADCALQFFRRDFRYSFVITLFLLRVEPARPHHCLTWRNSETLHHEISGATTMNEYRHALMRKLHLCQLPSNKK